MLLILPLTGHGMRTAAGAGPSRRWAQTSGPTGGVVLCIAVSGRSLFAGTDGGGVFRSTDDGAHWTVVDDRSTNTVVRALAASGTSLLAGICGSGVWRCEPCGTRRGPAAR